MKTQPETISISKFKATCLAVLERVRRTGKPIVVTSLSLVTEDERLLTGRSWKVLSNSCGFAREALTPTRHRCTVLLYRRRT